MSAKSKSITVVSGMFSGALITAALAALDFWVLTYTDTRESFLHEYAVWLATIMGAVLGSIFGAVVGIFLGFLRRGPLFGAVAGAIASVAIILLLILNGVYPSGDERVDLIIQLFVPIGAISGFLTSLVVSSVTSWRARKDHGPVEPEPQPPRRNRILF